MARHEKANFRAELDISGDPGSWWRVMPAYKFRSEGDKVRFGDAVILANWGGSALHLHVAEDEANSSECVLHL